MQKAVGKTVCVLTAVLLLLMMVSCQKPQPVSDLTDAEAVEILTELLPDAQLVLRILWGNELHPADPDAEPLASVTAAQYYPVSDDSPYHTVAAIKTLAESVYSPAYCALLYELAFDGSQYSYELPPDDPEGEETGKTEVTTFYPRFREENGVLSMDITFDTTRYRLEAEPDPATAKIVSRGVDCVTAEVSYTAGDRTGTMRISLVSVEGVWKLDSPTY